MKRCGFIIGLLVIQHAGHIVTSALLLLIPLRPRPFQIHSCTVLLVWSELYTGLTENEIRIHTGLREQCVGFSSIGH